MADSSRLFFALWPDARSRRQFERAAKILHRACGGKMTRSDSIHLTLAFLGAVDNSKIDSLKALAAEIRADAFDLAIDRSGYWKHNRIAWAGCSENSAQLSDLAGQLADKLRQAGYTLETRPFAAHVTLLRHADSPEILPEIVPFCWQVDRFSLVESVSTETGVRYRQLAGWGLGACRDVN